MFIPSIDRIDPKGGYTTDNCRFVLQGINAFKGQETDENMYRIAEALLSTRKSTSYDQNGAPVIPVKTAPLDGLLVTQE